MSTFLVEYEPSSGELVDLRQFPVADRDAAQAERLEREKRNSRSHIRREVVLLEAESKEALYRTHARYFKSLSELATA